MSKMTDNEIMECADRCCKDATPCLACPFDDVSEISAECMGELIMKLLDVITSKNEIIDGLIAGQETLQKCIAEKDAEIEDISNHLHSQQTVYFELGEIIKKQAKEIEEAKSEAIKEILSLVIQRLNRKAPVPADLINVLYDVKKEMAGENNV